MPKKFLQSVCLMLLLTAFTTSCREGRPQPDVSDIAIESHFHRFDKALFETDTNHFEQELPKLKENFSSFFTSDTSYSFWYDQRTEDLQIELFQKVQKEFGDMAELNADLNRAMKYYYHYFGTEDTIQFYSYISRLDFQYPIVFADSLCFAGTDLFLGPKAQYYSDMPEYMAFYRQKKFLIRDCLEAIIQPSVPRRLKGETLLDAMVYFGKKLYVLERLMPSKSKANIIKYKPEKMEFCRKNEKQMWVYFIENKLLYKTKHDLKKRFISWAPFSKFRTGIDKNTPGRVGQWLGWQIVNNYMDKNRKVSLQKLLEKRDSRKILRESGYRP